MEMVPSFAKNTIVVVVLLTIYNDNMRYTMTRLAIANSSFNGRIFKKKCLLLLFWLVFFLGLVWCFKYVYFKN